MFGVRLSGKVPYEMEWKNSEREKWKDLNEMHLVQIRIIFTFNHIEHKYIFVWAVNGEKNA